MYPNAPTAHARLSGACMKDSIMALTLEKTALGYKVKGPETEGPNVARVGVEEIDGKLRFYVSTKSAWLSPERAECMAGRLNDCVKAIGVLVGKTDLDLLHESHLSAASASGVTK